MRSAAISCVIACGAMVAGPGALGSAVASADGLFGVDVDVLDIFGHHNKSDHVGVEVGLGLPQLGGGISGGVAGRAPNLAPVPTAPSTRSVVIRAEHPAFVPAAPAAPAPVSVPPVVPSAVVVPLAPVPVPSPLAPVPAPSPLAPVQSPAAPRSPVIQQPRTNFQRAPAHSLSPQAGPESFRAGYADYLRVADVSVLMAVALPGVAGLLALTAGGVVLGYRQARAGHAAIVRMEIARFLR